ncbi:hypothetical protein F511_40785 [Dorcoceras hygrometricum]|uniref:RING-type domain-containing protein n=1 Tax=Dorcoceras hygrometricum TaxID=472368 RepID=A0A2Z7CQ88_9LAMI|nr:hypothetical protein F511_40785 [Dorcoceras hygrometricum]
MGLSNFSTPSEGILPLLVLNAVMSVHVVRNVMRTFLQVFGAAAEDEYSDDDSVAKRVSGKRWRNRGGDNNWAVMECCVCLRRFKENERVSELCCNHLFHRCCLEKWFDNDKRTCPLCRRFVI